MPEKSPAALLCIALSSEDTLPFSGMAEEIRCCCERAEMEEVATDSSWCSGFEMCFFRRLLPALKKFTAVLAIDWCVEFRSPPPPPALCIDEVLEVDAGRNTDAGLSPDADGAEGADVGVVAASVLVAAAVGGAGGGPSPVSNSPSSAELDSSLTDRTTGG